MRTEWTPEQISPTDPQAELDRLRELLEGRERTAAVAELDRELADLQASDRQLERRSK